MLKFERIVNEQHPYFEKAFELYEESFPIFERRTLSSQISVFKAKGYFFNIGKPS